MPTPSAAQCDPLISKGKHVSVSVFAAAPAAAGTNSNENKIEINKIKTL